MCNVYPPAASIFHSCNVICGPVHHPNTYMQFKILCTLHLESKTSGYDYFLFTQYLLNILHAIYSSMVNEI